MVYWYRTFSRIETKLGTLELDIYDKNFDVSEMIDHFNLEFKKFIEEMII